MIPGMIDDYQSYYYENDDDFIEHRHDQAILTNLAIREGYKLHFWSVQYGDNARIKYPADKYPSHFFEHHRYRNNEH